MNFLTNISKSMTDHQLRLEPVACGLLEMMHGLDHDSGAHMNQRIKKIAKLNGSVFAKGIHRSPDTMIQQSGVFFFFSQMSNYMTNQ